MTVQGLLLLILLVIFLQLVIYAGVGMFRHWLAYQALKDRVGEAAAGTTAGANTTMTDSGNPREMPAMQGHRSAHERADGGRDRLLPAEPVHLAGPRRTRQG